QSAYAGNDLLEDFAAFGLPGFFGGRAIVVIDLDGGGAVGLKAEIDVEHFDKAPQQQARTDQQHAGERDLEDHQRGADAFVLASKSCARAGVLEHFLKITAGDPEPWKQAEDHGGEDGDENRPAQRLAIDAKGAEERESHGSLMREPCNQNDSQ